jgi:hypothetical protein
MISKLQLQAIIEKYHLNGQIENVKWEIDADGKLTINFTAPTREMLGTVTYNGFPLPESEIGINNTTQLDKLLSITGGDLDLGYAKEGRIISKLLIADNQFNLDYALADLLTIPKTGKYNGSEDHEIQVAVDNEAITALVKAKNALTNSDNVVVRLGLNGLEFTFGGDVEYANKVTYSIQNPTINVPSTFNLVYGSDLLKEILVANKGSESGTLYINSNGLMKLTFSHKELQSTYYIVAKEQ